MKSYFLRYWQKTQSKEKKQNQILVQSYFNYTKSKQITYLLG